MCRTSPGCSDKTLNQNRRGSSPQEAYSQNDPDPVQSLKSGFCAPKNAGRGVIPTLPAKSQTPSQLNPKRSNLVLQSVSIFVTSNHWSECRLKARGIYMYNFSHQRAVTFKKHFQRGRNDKPNSLKGYPSGFPG